MIDEKGVNKNERIRVGEYRDICDGGVRLIDLALKSASEVTPVLEHSPRGT